MSLRYLNRDARAANGFSTGVSLHSHTMHSKESASFVERLARKSPSFRKLVSSQLNKYAGDDDIASQVRRMWWTSPLSAKQAFEVERRQITQQLGLKALVSISDHDDIDAPMQLQMLAENSEAPISVEWTTPYKDTYFHMGVHNMHPSWAREMMDRMERFTAAPTESQLRIMFAELSDRPDVLVILNHPIWDQPWLGQRRHEALVREFLDDYAGLIHALEINGLRSWQENRKVLELSRETGVKLISGGDRHGFEPNATLNLTNASTFAEFVDEIRSGAESHILVMPQFHDPLVLRVIQTMWDVLKDNPDASHDGTASSGGRVRWNERVFRVDNRGEVRSLAEFGVNPEPWAMRRIMGLTRFLASERLRPAWQRMAAHTEAVL